VRLRLTAEQSELSSLIGKQFSEGTFLEVGELQTLLMSEFEAKPELVFCCFIDPILDDPMSDWLEMEQALEAGIFRKIKIPTISMDLSEESQPYLLACETPFKYELEIQAVLEKCYEQGMPSDEVATSNSNLRSVCSVFSSDVEMFLVASSLAKAATVLKSNTEVNGMPLRFWDPRVTWLLPDKIHTLLGRELQKSIENWWFCLPDNGFVDMAPSWLNKTERNTQPSDEKTPVTKVDIDDLRTIGQVNRLITQIDISLLEDGMESVAKLKKYLKDARALGMTAEFDQAIFASCAWMGGARFYEHELVSIGLNDCLQKGSSAGIFLVSLPEDTWEVIANQMNSASVQL
jgi:hypothetical protein